MKKLGMIIWILLGVLFVLGPGKDWAIRSAVMVGAKGVIGADVKMKDFSLNLFSQSLKIRDLKIFNPEGFGPDQIMLDVPEIAVAVDMPALLRQTLHVKYMRFDLREARVIKNDEGALNVNALKFAQKKGKDSPKKMAMRFDLVSLNVGDVILEDHSGKRLQPKVSTYHVNLKNKEFKNINSAEQLAATVMFSALTPVGLGGAFSSLKAGVIDKAAGTANQAIGRVLRGMKLK